MVRPVKQAIPVSFAKGLDTKTDPKQIAIGNFLSLNNMVFDTGGQLKKRNGYQQLSTLPNTSYSYLTTFHNNLTAVGTSIAAQNSGNETWVTKGNIQPMSVSTLPMVRNNLNQTACDSAIAANGLVCVAYIETDGVNTTNKYAIYDSVTGQNIVAPTAIPVGSGTVSGGMRVYVLGTYFVIVFTNTISAITHLQYIKINTNIPTQVGTNTDIASSYVSSNGLSWDAAVSGQTLYIAYDTTSGGQAVKITYLTSSFTLATAASLTGFTATLMSLCCDTSGTSTFVYVFFYNSGSSTGYIAQLDHVLNIIMNPMKIITAGTLLNLTTVAQNGSCYAFFEVANTYAYDSSIASNYVEYVQVTPLGTTFKSVFSAGAGTIAVSSATGLVNGMFLIDNTTSGNIADRTSFTVSGTTLTLSNNTVGNSAGSPGDTLTAVTIGTYTISARSIGLASKAFIINGVMYYLASYQSTYQPTYFLINASSSTQSSPVIAGKLAYQNGGGYLTLGLPNVSISGTTATIPYLYKDLIQAVNKNTNVPTGTQTAGVYSQTGVNLASFDIGTQGLYTTEIGNDLHLTGGFLWMYDGQIPVEHNFFLYPDMDTTTPTNAASYTAAPVTPTGTFSNASKTITVSSATGIAIGMLISDTTNPTYIPSGTTVTSINGTTIGISKATTNAGAGDALSISGAMAAKPDGATNTNAYYYQVTYEWTDNQGNAFKSSPSIPIAVTTTGAASTGSVTLNIPTLRLTYKVASAVKIVIYRWSVGQQIYYQTTSITAPLLNSTTTDYVTYVDTSSDASILGNNVIYTTGGVVEDINAPATNIMALFDTRLWLVSAEDPNLLYFSKQVIEATPVEMSDLFTYYIPPNTATEQSTGSIGALFPMDDKLIIFKKQSAIVYINGSGPDNTGSNNQYSQPIFVTSTVGCSNQNSIVLMPQGLMFQASSGKGIWLLDRGLNTQYIGAPVEKYNSYTVMSAVNIPSANQVRFLMSNGITLVYDYYYGQWGTFSGVSAISSCIYQNLHTYINSNGLVYQENPGSYLDGGNPVLMSFQTGPLRLGDLQNYQRTFFYYLLGTYISPHKLVMTHYYDYSSTPQDQFTISPGNYSPPFGNISPYGQATPFGGPSNLEDWRIFANRRCMALSIGMQEIFDPSYGTIAGAGLTLSGISLVCGFKAPFRAQSAATSVG